MTPGQDRDAPGGVSVREWALRVLYPAAVIAVFALFLYSVRAILWPPVLFLLFLFLVAPLYGSRLYLPLVLGGAGVFLLWVLRALGFLLAPFVLALIVAYVLDPVVDRLERRRVRRPLALAVLSLPVVGLVLLVVLVAVPALGRELASLTAAVLPSSLDAFTAWLEGLRSRIVALGIPGIHEQSVPHLREIDEQRIVQYLSERREIIGRRIWQAVLGVGRGIGFLATLFGYVVLTPILSYYLLRDYDRLKGWCVGLIPSDRRARWLEFGDEYDRLLSRYLRGQVLIAASVGILTYLGFLVLGFPQALLLGAIAGVFNLVPYLGLWASLVPALVIAFASGSVLISLLKVAIVFGIVQTLDAAVLSPLIVGGSVGLHPVWVILALAVFGSFFGFVGLLLAVPLALLLKVALSRAVAGYRRSVYYGAPGADEGSSKP